jgi:anti-sigma-K factor RskA
MAEQAHVTELLPAYALGCLDPEEAVQVSEHLVSCIMCRSELLAFEEVADKLNQSIPQVDPPAIIKTKLMARVMTSVEVKPKAEGRFTSKWKLSFSAVPTPAIYYMVVSLVFIILLGASNLILWNQLDRLKSTTRSSMQTVVLQGTENAPDAHAMIVISNDGAYGTLVVDHLPALEQGKQYQLWLITDGDRTSGGVFTVSPDGYKSIEVYSPRPLISYHSFGVTIEPEGGSPGPTGAKVLGGGF